MPPRKRPLEAPENPRPSKRVATTPLPSSSTNPHPAGSVDLNESSLPKRSKVDTVVHQYLDDCHLRREEFDKLKSDSQNRILRYIFQLIMGEPEAYEKLDPAVVELIQPVKYAERWDAFVRSHPDLIDVLLDCWSKDPPSFDEVLELEYFQKRKPQVETSQSSFGSPADYNATVEAWSKEFRGNSAQLLHDTLRSYLDPSTTGHLPYANHVPLVQSSGTGKSRTLDELAKRIICIPLNLGSKTENSKSIRFPPADSDKVRDFVLKESGSQVELQIHHEGFCIGSLIVTKRCLQEIQDSHEDILSPDAIGKEEDRKSATLKRLSLLAKEFRARMSAVTTSREAKDSEPESKYGEYRETFYDEVIEEAEKFISCAVKSDLTQYNSATDDATTPPPTAATAPISPTRRHINKEGSHAGAQSVADAGKALYEFLDPWGVCEKEPLLVMGFDESHCLTDEIEHQTYTRFSELRRSFRALNPFPFLFVFLSTGGKFHQFSPDYTFDASNRIQQRVIDLLPPITEVGFDQFAPRVVADGSWTLDHLASTHQISHLGRSLFPTRYDNGDQSVRERMGEFARVKVLGDPVTNGHLNDEQKLACILLRLCVEFRGTHWLDRLPERIQVERHLRLCLSATAGFQYMFTISPSEPLLADAAFSAMAGWSAAAALLTHIKSSHLSSGERGELIVALLALLARDQATLRNTPLKLDPPASENQDSQAKGKGKAKAEAETKSRGDDVNKLEKDGEKRVVRVIDFLKALLPESCHEQLKNHTPYECLTPDASTKTLEETFEHAHIYFNHFIKVRDFKVVGEEFLWHYIVRGAAIICANNHGGIDILIPILFNNRLRKENVSAILIQVKNDPHYTSKINYDILDSMNPFGLAGVFSDKVESPRPVIRMVFALASPKSAIKFDPAPSARRSPRNTKKAETRPEPLTRSGKPTRKSTCFDIWCAGCDSKTFRVIKENEDHIYLDLLDRTRNSHEPYDVDYGSMENRADRSTARRVMHAGGQSALEHYMHFTGNHVDQKEDPQGEGSGSQTKATEPKGRTTDRKGKGKALNSTRTLRPRVPKVGP